LRLGNAVNREDNEDAARLKVAIAEQEQCLEAAFLRDNAGAGCCCI